MPKILVKADKHSINKDREIEVADSDIVGDLYAIHPFFINNGFETSGWTASHIPSGGCIGKVKSAAIAKRLAKKLLPLTTDSENFDEVFVDKFEAFSIVKEERQKAA